MWAPLQSVIVKSWKAKVSIYVSTLTYADEIMAATERLRLQIQATKISFLQRVAWLRFRDRVRGSNICMMSAEGVRTSD